MSDGNGWQKWKGGKCPVTPETRVQVEYGPNHPWPGDISSFAPARVWGSDYWETPGDISAWRLHTPEREAWYDDLQETLVANANARAAR